MDHGMAKLAVAVTALVVGVTFSAVPAFAYTNHTVGGPAGWLFDDTTNTSSANYSSWAASQSFNLGDYLIFNTNTNMTVVQTYNATTYGLCSADEDNSNETFVYSDDGTDAFGVPMVAEVPLTVVGPNYYFSDAGDPTVQCRSGMRFQINVGQGQGLPPELNQPPPSPNAATHSPPTSPSTTSPGGATAGRSFGSGSCRRYGGGAGRLLLFFLAVFGSVV